MTFGHLYIRSPNWKTSWKKSPPGSKTPPAAAASAPAAPSVQTAAPGSENTMAVRDRKASKLRPKSA